MNCSTSGLPVHHQLSEFTQTHVHQVGDAIQPSNPLSSPSPPAPNPSQNQSFPRSQLFPWGGQSIGISASASVLPMNTQDRSPLGWIGWISLQSKGLKSLLQHHSSKETILKSLAFLTVQLSHTYMTTGKTIALTIRTFVGKVMSLLLNTLSRLVITFLPRSKRLLILWLQSPSAVILEPPKNKVWHCFPIYFPWIDGTRCHDLSFLNIELYTNFFTLLFPFNKRLFSSSSLSAIRVVLYAYLRLLTFLPAILIPACASSSPAFLVHISLLYVFLCI